MDSINRQQPEDTRKDLGGVDALDRIREVVEAADTCFFCTARDGADHSTTRPMSVRTMDDDGTLWFLSAIDTHKDLELAADDTVRLYFQAGKHAGFLVLNGTATVSQDKARIKALWSPMLKTWFTGGVDDPRISVIAFRPSSGYYWDNKHGAAVAGVKMLIGAALGRTLDDSVQGRLRP